VPEEAQVLRDVLYWAVAVAAVAGGVAVFRVRSMARATYALLVSFVAVAVVLVLLSLDYLGAVTVLMMLMEMALMAVFMLMYMMSPAGFMPMSMVHSKRTALVMAAGTFAVLSAGALLVPWPSRSAVPAGDATQSIGFSIMGSKMLVMLTVSPLLFATLVAVVVLASARSRYDTTGTPAGGTSRAMPDSMGER